MGFNSNKAGQGAVAGAATGVAFAPQTLGVSILAGAAVGSLMGGLSGDSSSYSPDEGLYYERLRNISNFSKQLAKARLDYNASLQNMYSTAFNQYMPDAAAFAAGQGKQISGGAYGSGLGRQSAMYTAQGMANNAQGEIEDINTVESYRSNAFNNMFGASNQARMFNSQQQNQDSSQMGALTGNALMMGMQSYMGGSSRRWESDPSNPMSQNNRFNPNYLNNPINPYRRY